MNLSPRERVERAVRFEDVDHVPFTVYECMIPQCEDERRMRNDGLCIVQRSPSVYGVRAPGISSESHTYVEDGRQRTKTIIHTPRGDLTEVREPAGFTSWTIEFPFKGPEDYEKLIAMTEAREFFLAPEAFLRKQEMMGGDATMRGGCGYEPMQQIIYRYMGPETFAIEWAERRDEVMRLFDAIVEERRRLYPVLAESPCQYFNYGGNVSPEIVGPERFREYYVPHYQEFCEIMHAAGKTVGVHFDANTALIADAIAETDLDYIEAWTPPPDCDLSITDARAKWPDKALWINFPSSVFLRSDEEIEEFTAQMLREAAPGNGFIIGITEDMPPDRWRPGMLAINRAILEHGRLPITS
ncbi:MAG: hypothetical protein J7M38_10555 [Armatimonadetes bacterium]|nr:hypothetical protein [Armatimonadota bacterium]